MCGIAGICGKKVSPDNIRQMVAALQRRGPDDFGVWMDGEMQIALGHARLSVIDLSAAGHQPMIAKDEGFVIVFNGEIYNYKELRVELESHGAVFQSNSDTEVLLWGWRIWGERTPERLRGMFAFGIWDAKKRMLTLVRDRMGIKPLLWHRDANGVVFASSLKAMLASEEVPRILDEFALFDYLLQGAVLQPRTIIKGVQALPPATMMEFSCGSDGCVGEGRSKTYWIPYSGGGGARNLVSTPYEELVRLTRLKLEDACRYHLIADVPIGSFLSGGVDSTAITALMSQLSGKRIKSFSIGYSRETGMQDELSDARTAAQHIGCEHTEVVLTGKDVAEHFDDFIEVLDQPSIDGLNTYWVSKVTREHGVKVALSGLGGDELFAGYDHFRWPDMIKYQALSRKSLPGAFGGLVDWMWLLIYRQLPYARHPFERCRYLMPLNESLIALRRFMSEAQLERYLKDELAKVFQKNHLLTYVNGLSLNDFDLINQITKYECKNYLLNTLLRDADALSMGHGLEVRPIFLDHILVEHALAVPASCKYRNGVLKAVLKDAATDLLPPDFFKRKKTGFVLPIDFWLSNDLRDRYLDTVSMLNLGGIFNKKFIDNMQRISPPKRITHLKWQMLVFSAWVGNANVSL